MVYSRVLTNNLLLEIYYQMNERFSSHIYNFIYNLVAKIYIKGIIIDNATKPSVKNKYSSPPTIHLLPQYFIRPDGSK